MESLKSVALRVSQSRIISTWDFIISWWLTRVGTRLGVYTLVFPTIYPHSASARYFIRSLFDRFRVPFTVPSFSPTFSTEPVDISAVNVAMENVEHSTLDKRQRRNLINLKEFSSYSCTRVHAKYAFLITRQCTRGVYIRFSFTSKRVHNLQGHFRCMYVYSNVLRSCIWYPLCSRFFQFSFQFFENSTRIRIACFLYCIHPFTR